MNRFDEFCKKIHPENSHFVGKGKNIVHLTSSCFILFDLTIPTSKSVDNFNTAK